MNGRNVLTALIGILFCIAIGFYVKSRPVVPKEEISPPKRVMEIEVRKGWYLSKIADGLSTSVKNLIQLNGIKNPDLIYAGQTLKVIPYNRKNLVKISWYGADFHGKKMSNGEIFDMYNPEITAHKFLPFGTRTKLTRINNGKSIVVTVQDRGPYIEGRDFDLSYAAAKKLGIVDPGVVICKVEILN